VIVLTVCMSRTRASDCQGIIQPPQARRMPRLRASDFRGIIQPPQARRLLSIPRSYKGFRLSRRAKCR